MESLAELKQQQKALNQRITDLIHNLDKRFEVIDKRFDAIDKRFETNDRRFESMMNWMLTLFGIVITLILEMHNPSGTLLERLVAAFRELAKTDEKVADVLKTFSLL